MQAPWLEVTSPRVLLRDQQARHPLLSAGRGQTLEITSSPCLWDTVFSQVTSLRSHFSLSMKLGKWVRTRHLALGG